MKIIKLGDGSPITDEAVMIDMTIDVYKVHQFNKDGPNDDWNESNN